MYTIRMPSGQYLDGEHKLAFEWNNQVLSTSDASVLPGSFTFPADVPLTDRNRVELGHPHLVANAAGWQAYDGAVIECYGIPMFTGRLTIRKCDDRKASISVVANALYTVRDVLLSDLDLGGDRAVADWPAHMLATADTPEGYDYAFFPVWNPDHNDYPDTDTYYDERSWQNYWDIATGAFTETAGAITPFARVDYVLQAIFAGAGFSVDNAWQTTEELRRLYLYHNNDARVLQGSYPSVTPGLPSIFNLKNHVPAIKAREFLKKLVAQWGLGFFTGVQQSDRVTILPVQAALNRPPRHDWTLYSIDGTPREEALSPARAYDYDQPVELPPGVPRPHQAIQQRTLGDLNTTIAGLSPGVYWFYLEDGHVLIRIDKTVGGFSLETYLQHGGVYPYGDTETPLDTGMECLRTLYGGNEGFGYYAAPGKVSRWQPVGAGYERRQEQSPVALMLYRGIQDDGDGDVPLAANHVWLPSGSGGTRSHIISGGVSLGESDYSLNWFGDRGLYAQFHRLFGSVMNGGKHVTIRFHLPVAQLVDFSFQDKVRVSNMDYFVKRLRVSDPVGRGRVMVEASMVSVI